METIQNSVFQIYISVFALQTTTFSHLDFKESFLYFHIISIQEEVLPRFKESCYRICHISNTGLFSLSN